MDNEIKIFIKSASIDELSQYLKTLTGRRGNKDLIDLISFILENVNKTS